MLSNLLNTLLFGSVIQQNGKSYTVIIRLTDRLFVGMEQNAQLPAPLMLVQVDLKMGPPGGASGGGQTQGQAIGAQRLAEAERRAKPSLGSGEQDKIQEDKPSPDTAPTEDAAPTDSNKPAPDAAPTGSDTSFASNASEEKDKNKLH